MIISLKIGGGCSPPSPPASYAYDLDTCITSHDHRIFSVGDETHIAKRDCTRSAYESNMTEQAPLFTLKPYISQSSRL